MNSKESEVRTPPLGYLVKRVQSAFRLQMDAALSHLQIGSATYAALFHLAKEGPLNGSELARASWVTPQTMHRIALDLSKKGLLRRAGSSGRALLWDLTKKGHRVLREADSAVNAIDARMCSRLSNGEQEILARLLERCASALEHRDI